MLSGLLLCTGAGAARGQAVRHDGMTSLIPPKAVFFMERRGHQAIREVFLRSNFGKMAQDGAIGEFADATRRRLERLMVKEDADVTDGACCFCHGPCC